MSHGGSINKTFIIDDIGNIISACTSVYTNRLVSCSGNTVIQLQQDRTTLNTDLIPKKDDDTKVGRRNKRFREINTVSGKSTIWTSRTVSANTVDVKTIDLGYDNTANEQRIINKLTSVIKNDKILGGSY